MRKSLRIIFCVVLCTAASLPFVALVDFNRVPDPYPPLPARSGYQIASILFMAEFCLSAVGLFLLFVKRVLDSGDDSYSGFGVLVFAALSVFCMWRLCDFGDGVMWNRFYDSFCLARHPGTKAISFYGYMTVVWLGILIAAASSALGVFADD